MYVCTYDRDRREGETVRTKRVWPFLPFLTELLHRFCHQHVTSLPPSDLLLRLIPPPLTRPLRNFLSSLHLLFIFSTSLSPKGPRTKDPYAPLFTRSPAFQPSLNHSFTHSLIIIHSGTSPAPKTPGLRPRPPCLCLRFARVSNPAVSPSTKDSRLLLYGVQYTLSFPFLCAIF